MDNTPSTYSMQPSNGLPIPSWTGNSSDDHLYRIAHILEKLSEVDDVRSYIPQIVRNARVLYSKASAILAVSEKTRKQEMNLEKSPVALNNKEDNLFSPDQKASVNVYSERSDIDFLSPSYVRDHTELISTQKVKMGTSKDNHQKIGISEYKKKPKKGISSKMIEDNFFHQYNQMNNTNKGGMKKQQFQRKSTADPNLNADLYKTKNIYYQNEAKEKFKNIYLKKHQEEGFQNNNTDSPEENSKILMKKIGKEKETSTVNSNKSSKDDKFNLNTFSKILANFNNSNYISFSNQVKRKA